MAKQAKKKTKYKSLPKYQGIYTIWDWNSNLNRYVKRNKGLKYYVYKKVQGVQFTKCFETLEEAKEARSTWKPANQSIKNTNKLLFSDIANEYFEHVKSSKSIKQQTIDSYENCFKHLFYFLKIPINEIKSQTIDQWLRSVKDKDYLASQHKTRITYKKELSLLRIILTYYSEYLNEDYSLPIKKRHSKDIIVDNERYLAQKAKNEERYIPSDELNKFVKRLKLKSHSKQRTRLSYLACIIQSFAGVRIGEACSISVDDICLESNSILISKTIVWGRKKGRKDIIQDHTKTRNIRRVFIDDFIMLEIKNWLAENNRAKGLIISYDGITPFKYRSMQYDYNKTFKELEMEFSSSHILRHSHATNFLEATGDIVALKKLLGHSNISQTEHYAKITTARTQKAFNIYQESQLKDASNVLSFNERLDEAR